MSRGATFHPGPGCKRHVAAAVLGALLAWAVPASAQNSDEMARRHFESGVAYLEESDYDSALKAFEKAYELSKRPAILLNIATVQERRGDTKAAIAALKSYVEVEPNGEHAETAKLRIQNLEKRLAEAPPAEPAPAPTPAPAAEPPPPAPAPAPPPAHSDEPPPNRMPAFVALGIGGLAAGGALITGIVAQNQHSDLENECSPNCTDDDVSGAKTMAWVSTGLTGVAIVGVGVGVVLLLTSSPKEEQARRDLPRLDVAVGPRGSEARATFAF